MASEAKLPPAEAEQQPNDKAKFKPMKCLSPLDHGSLGIIDQNANTSNHVLFEQIQAAMFTWFNVTGETTDALTSIRRQIENQNQPPNITQKSALDFLLNVFPCDFSISARDENERTDQLGRLIKQFYFVGPVGERFFHWMFLLGAADKEIVWKAGNPKDSATRNVVKGLKPCKKYEACVQNDRQVGSHIWDVPFWRALAQTRDSLTLHLNDYIKSAALNGSPKQPNGLYPDFLDPTITNERGSGIFTIEHIYTHAKDTFTFSFIKAGPKQTADEISAAQISNIRGQLEFEWLITRPYSPVWKNKHAPASRAAGDETSLPPKSSSNRSPAQVEMSSLVGPSKKKDRSGSIGGLALNEILGVSSLSDIEIAANERNLNYDWNESMWQSVSKLVDDDQSSDVGPLRNSIFFERSSDYVDNYTGENLFHLFVSNVHNTDDADGHAAAEKIRTLLKFVKHPAYRLELLTSKVTGRFFCPVNGSVRLGQTPLHFAVSLGKWEAVAALLEDACCLLDECYTETGEKSGEHVKLKDLKTQGSLSEEQEKANKTIDMAYLDQLKRQYSVLWTKDSQGNSVFHLAVIHNRKDMYLKLHKFSEKLSKLLESHYFGEGKKNEKKTKDEREYEFYVGSKFNSFEAYDDEFLKNDNGYTPLELAAYLGNVSMIRFLLNTFETNVKWSFADRSVALKKMNIRDLDTYKTLVHPRSFSEKWIDLIAAEDLEPNLLSIVVSREKVDFLQDHNFPEFSAVLQQKWEVFGKRLMTIWIILVLVVFVLFQVHIGYILQEIKGVPNASNIQQNLAYALYIIAGVYLAADTIFEYSLGIIQSEKKLENVGATCPVGTRQYPIDLFVVDTPPWKFHEYLKEIIDDKKSLLPNTASRPETCFGAFSSFLSTRESEIKDGLKELSLFIQKRHHSYKLETECDSGSTATEEFGWEKDKTKLFRHFVGFNFLARSSLGFCSKILQHHKKVQNVLMDVVISNRKTHMSDSGSKVSNFASVALNVFLKSSKMMRHILKCFFGFHDQNCFYSHMWCITILLSGLSSHIYKNSDLGVTFSSAATVFIFLYIFRFYLLIESLGVYMVMIKRMLTTDLTKWIAVAAVYLVAFAEAFVLIGSVLEPEKSSEGFFLIQFKWIVGDTGTDGFEENENLVLQNPILHRFAFVLFVIFLLLLPICLVNMLTGMFGKTCESYLERAKALHRYNFAVSTLSLERVLYRLPIPILWLLGFRCSLSILWDNYFVRLLWKRAPMPPKVIFRHHWTAFHSICSFWPSRFTFVNCRTGYPLQSAQSLFHEEKVIPGAFWFKAPFSFFTAGVNPDHTKSLRMDSERAFWHLPKVLQRFENGWSVSEQTWRKTYQGADLRLKLFHEIETHVENLGILLAEQNFDQKMINRVIIRMKAFAQRQGSELLERSEEEADRNRFIHQFCALMELECVNTETYHLLTLDFSNAQQ